jgi:hypothetical protein
VGVVQVQRLYEAIDGVVLLIHKPHQSTTSRRRRRGVRRGIRRETVSQGAVWTNGSYWHFTYLSRL